MEQGKKGEKKEIELQRWPPWDPRRYRAAAFLRFTRRVSSLNATALCEREESIFVCLPLWSTPLSPSSNGKNASFTGANVLFGAFIHSFVLMPLAVERPFRFNVLCPAKLFLFRFFPLAFSIKGRLFLRKVTISDLFEHRAFYDRRIGNGRRWKITLAQIRGNWWGQCVGED